MSAAAVALHHAVDGPAGGRVLLLGGSLGTTLAMWEPQVAVLSSAMRVVRFDHRGHGGSPVPDGPYAIEDLGRDVLALMDALGLERACYCGLSIGGMVGQWLAINAPERIERVILLCTGAYLPPPQQWHERAAAVRAAGTPEVLADAVVARWFTAPFAAANPDLVARHRAMIAATDPTGYAGCCEAIAGMDLRAGLASVRVPALVVSGAQDPSIPAEHGRAVAAAIPGARFELLDPAAHLATVERADAVNELIAGFVRGEPGSDDRRAGQAGDGEPVGDARYETGMRVRREVLGDDHVARAQAGATEFTRDFQRHITELAWGSVWTRAGLDRRTRSAITLAALTALGREGELELHVRAALRNGLGPDEISEILIHTSVYAGLPAANAAFRIAQRVIDEESEGRDT